MKLTPLFGHVLVEYKENDVMASGIMVRREDDISRSGTVLGVASDLQDSGIEVGDVVYFAKYAGENIEFFNDDGKKEKYIVLKANSLLAFRKK